MQRMNIKCCHCGDYTPFITEENIEVIPQVNLTRTDMDCLGDIAEALDVYKRQRSRSPMRPRRSLHTAWILQRNTATR